MPPMVVLAVAGRPLPRLCTWRTEEPSPTLGSCTASAEPLQPVLLVPPEEAHLDREGAEGARETRVMETEDEEDDSRVVEPRVSG